ncbi:MAG: hypothetical protein LC122_10865 [Chitinophagales bacterium]|nr:hypothetical protein [Chitinophagales bacterium]
MILFAIYKNGQHKGNERAINGNEAIKKYIIASDLKEFINDVEFIKQYSFKEAIEGVHYNEKILL